ncbi:hypothetical protein F869_01640 [Klebsiella pneumoniae subsp. pneumoniae CIP 52.145 = B5055]|nr:hypothetical protein F869_01640 [Klebsiella pneumoniae subsp. pneumoniae CIP 52.145 = B5055]
MTFKLSCWDISYLIHYSLLLWEHICLFILRERLLQLQEPKIQVPFMNLPGLPIALWKILQKPTKELNGFSYISMLTLGLLKAYWSEQKLRVIPP